jgi:hypothetical protein
LQIRKIEGDIIHEIMSLNEKITREIIQTSELADANLRLVEREVKDMIKDNAKQRMRDKADNDLRHNKVEDKVEHVEKKLGEQHEFSSTLSIVTTMLIENVNMQMESEMADLIDRRTMSLFGVVPAKVDKLVV